MALLNVLEDIKIWIAAAIVLALIFGFGSPDASTIMMLALIAQMAVALDGIRFSRSDFGTYRTPILLNLVCCFGICTGFTLLTGLFFIDNQALWTGWVMLSAVPCAISVVPSALFLRADPKLSVLSLIVIYVVAIGLTPFITHTLIGNSVNPLEVLRYILMFILIPFVLTIPIKRLHLKQAPKTLFINLMMFVLVFVGLGSRQEFVFSEPMVIIGLVVACVFFLVRMNNLTVVERATLPFNMPENVEAWHIKGALFFGSISKLEFVTDPTRITMAGSARIVVLDFEELLHIDNSAMDQIEVFVRALHRHNHELIIAGATGHPLAQLRRTGIAQALGPNLVPNMEFAMARARTVLAELDEKEKSRPVIRTL